MTDLPRLVVDILIPGLLMLAMSNRLSAGDGSSLSRRAAAVILMGVAIVAETLLRCTHEQSAIFVLNAIPLCVGLTFGTRIAMAGVLVAIPGIVAVCAMPQFTILSPASLHVVLLASAMIGGGTRAFVLNNDRPSPFVAAFLTVFVEAVGGLMTLLVVPIHDAAACSNIASFLPIQTVANAAAAAVAMFILPTDRTRAGETKRQSIAKTVQTILGCCSLIVLACSVTFIYLIQTNLAIDTVQRILRTEMKDVKTYLRSSADMGIDLVFDSVTKLLGSRPVTNERLRDIAKKGSAMEHGQAGAIIAVETRPSRPDKTDGPSRDTVPLRFPVKSIDVADASGIVTHSTDPRDIGLDISGYGPSRTFEPSRQDGTAARLRYAVRRLPDKRLVRIGLADGWLKPYVGNLATNWHIGDTGFVCIIDGDLNIISESNHRCTTAKDAGIAPDLPDMAPGTLFTDTIFDVSSYALYDRAEGYHLVASSSKEETMHKRNVAMTLSLTCGTVGFVLLSALVYVLIKSFVVDNIIKVNTALARIAAGDLEERVDIRSNEEFVDLSESINTTVGTLKRYIDEAAKRLDKELEFARSIQYSALPNVFPPYPMRHDLDIFAAMVTAKEVGGDFYDFALRKDDELVFLIADVSGKGIPAALFMMRAKATLKGYAEAGLTPEEIAARTNEVLCADNEANMFVTAWIGILNTETGETVFANAGHNPPLVRRGGEWSYLDSEPGLPLAAMDDVPYAGQRFRLRPGDAVVLYTDGVTEAMDRDGVAYGETRPIELLRSAPGGTAEDLCRTLRGDVAAFVGDAPQSDDVTMLALVFNGGRAS